MSRENERVLLCVGPQHFDLQRPIFGKVRSWGEYVQPLGIGIVASVLGQMGYSEFHLVTMEPGRIHKLEPLINQADLVAVSARHIDTSLAQAVIGMANGKPTIVGGYGPSLEAEEYAGATVVVKGEVESAREAIESALRSGQTGVVIDVTKNQYSIGENYIRPDRQVLDQLPKPPKPFRKFSQEWQRGCRNRCTFCSPSRTQGSFRYRLAEDIINENETLGIQAGDRLVSVDLNSALIPRDELYPLLEYLKTNRINWIGEATLMPLIKDIEEYGDEDSLLNLMSPLGGGGCVSLLYGADDLSVEKVKGSRDKEADLIAKGVAVCRRLGIPLNLSVIVGLDHHTYPDSILDIAQLLLTVRPGYSFIHIATPYQGTVWGDQVYRESRVFDTNPLHHNHRQVIHQPCNMSVEELQQSYFWLMKKLFNPGEAMRTAQANYDSRAWGNPGLLLLQSGLPWAGETWASFLELSARGYVNQKIMRELDNEFTQYTGTRSR